MIKLLENLKGSENRKARFRTVISLILNDKEFQFTGICPGEINLSPSGTRGFGYDPIFVPEGGNKSFGEMDKNEKNQFSHRRKAMDKLILFLQKNAE